MRKFIAAIVFAVSAAATLAAYTPPERKVPLLPAPRVEQVSSCPWDWSSWECMSAGPGSGGGNDGHKAMCQNLDVVRQTYSWSMQAVCAGSTVAPEASPVCIMLTGLWLAADMAYWMSCP